MAVVKLQLYQKGKLGVSALVKQHFYILVIIVVVKWVFFLIQLLANSCQWQPKR